MPTMRPPVVIENIEKLRRCEGIDDAELREEIRALRVDDSVKLTFLTLTEPPARETLSVRITSIRGGAFRSKLADRPAFVGLSNLRVGTPVTFTRAQIHSIPRERPKPRS